MPLPLPVDLAKLEALCAQHGTPLQIYDEARPVHSPRTGGRGAPDAGKSILSPATYQGPRPLRNLSVEVVGGLRRVHGRDGVQEGVGHA